MTSYVTGLEHGVGDLRWSWDLVFKQLACGVLKGELWGASQALWWVIEREFPGRFAGIRAGVLGFVRDFEDGFDAIVANEAIWEGVEQKLCLDLSIAFLTQLAGESVCGESWLSLDEFFDILSRGLRMQYGQCLDQYESELWRCADLLFAVVDRKSLEPDIKRFCERGRWKQSLEFDLVVRGVLLEGRDPCDYHKSQINAEQGRLEALEKSLYVDCDGDVLPLFRALLEAQWDFRNASVRPIGPDCMDLLQSCFSKFRERATQVAKQNS